MPRLAETASHIASSIVIFAVLIALGGVVAFLAARKFGNGSRKRERAIFSFASAIGLLLAATVLLLRLHARG